MFNDLRRELIVLFIWVKSLTLLTFFSKSSYFICSLLSPLHTFETKCHMYLIFSVIHVNFHYFILIFLFSPGDELLFTTEETGKETFDIISLKNTLPYSIAYKVYISYLLGLGGRVVVFNVTFNNISAISWELLFIWRDIIDL